MSNSIAAAKRRRAGIVEQAPPPPSPSPSPTTAPGTLPARLTLQQVISLLDARLVKLETTTAPLTADDEAGVDANVSISEYIAEMDNKFGMLVEEITNLKDVVMKLQSYTMDVNKMLTEERIHIMSEFTPRDRTNVMPAILELKPKESELELVAE